MHTRQSINTEQFAVFRWPFGESCAAIRLIQVDMILFHDKQHKRKTMKQKNKILPFVFLFICTLALTACSSNKTTVRTLNWPGLSVDNDIVYVADGNYIETIKDKVSYQTGRKTIFHYFAKLSISIRQNCDQNCILYC